MISTAPRRAEAEVEGRLDAVKMRLSSISRAAGTMPDPIDVADRVVASSTVSRRPGAVRYDSGLR